MPRDQSLHILIEKVAVLNGDRRGAKDREAVRKGSIPPIKTRSKEATGSPSKDDFNDLVKDVHDLIRALNRMSS